MRPRTPSLLPPLAVAVSVALLVGVSGCGDRVAGPSMRREGPGPQSAAGGDQKPTLELGGEVPNPPPHGGYSQVPSVPDHLVAEIAPGWTVAGINAQWGTTTLDVIPGSPFALLKLPYGTSYDYAASEMLAWGACLTCGRNYYEEAPEAKQASIAFYEGNLVGSDYADQEALIRVRAPLAHISALGTGTTVAVLDTGVDATHPDLAAVVRSDGWDFVDDDANPADTQDGLDQDGDGLVDEAAGHGTHVAGIVNAVAPAAWILPVRVLDSEGIGTVYDLARGIRFADQAGADVINLSLGLDAWSRIVEWAIRQAHGNGALVVASAGNDGIYSATHFPSSMVEVMGVAAVGPDDLKASFSNYGWVVALSAPGEGIVSTYLFHGYAVWSGTSMATPFVAGAGAIAREVSPAATADEVRQAIEDATTVPDHSGLPYNGHMGAGRLDVLPLAVPSVPGAAAGR